MSTSTVDSGARRTAAAARTAGAVALLVAFGLLLLPSGTAVAKPDPGVLISSTPEPTVHTTAGPPILLGRTVVLDPGHQAGDDRFPTQTSRWVETGDPAAPWSVAECVDPGARSDTGLGEAMVTWKVAVQLRQRLREAGARVLLTRDANSRERWGPCVDERGRIGNALGADLRISLHAGGPAAEDAVGFHVVAPAEQHPEAVRSQAFATGVRDALTEAGLPRATHVGEDGLDRRHDVAVLNHSEIPAVVVELGNLHAAKDARRLASRAGRGTYVDALTCAVLAHFGGLRSC